MSEGASRHSGKWQFTIAQALLATAFIGVCTGCAVNYGVGTAVAFGVLTSLLCIDLVRTVRRWNTLVLWRRAYGCVDISVLGVLLAAYVVFLACGTSPARQRNARHLQRDLQGDSRFSSVHVEYLELETAFLRVDGEVDSDRDVDALREIVFAYDWRNMDDVRWNVTVGSPKRVYDGWDSELFGNDG
ncbi:MAG: hypothetical protein NTW96_10570 [Planctomycetia bacterium]|nr:hypothetical protein [Planctomycetia bacterium]